MNPGLSRIICTFTISDFRFRVTKLATSLNGGEQLFDSEWIQLADHMQVQWMETLSELIHLLSPDGEREEAMEGVEESKCEVGVQQAFEAVEKWLEDTMNYIENEDSNIVDQVSAKGLKLIGFLFISNDFIH